MYPSFFPSLPRQDARASRPSV
ncbi:unnamed protein product [Ectocarpus sp. CCAP 1310/34]|nr:unnamed protein product [Ectocarpus sp. CCAP 1310/34]